MHRFMARIVEPDIPSLAVAEERAAALEAENPGKRAIVYAIVNGRAHPVPEDIRAAARGEPKKEKEAPAMPEQKSVARPLAALNKTRAADAARAKAKKDAKHTRQDRAPTKRASPDDQHAAAKAGHIPAPPDFSAKSRERYRPKLQGIVDLVVARDHKALKALTINPVDSAHKIMARYRDHALLALQAQAKGSTP